MRPEVHPTPARALAVMPRVPDEASGWAPLVREVERALDISPVVEVLAEGAVGGRTVDRLLMRASQAGVPVLVLPVRPAHGTHRHQVPAHGVAGRPPDGEGAHPALQRVLIASDASEEVAAGAHTLSSRLAAAGVHATILHVLTDDNRPRMWEGAGHHAAVWFDELTRRHGTTAEVLRVAAGEPGDVLRAHAVGADLVVMLWRRQLAPGRAAIVRTVLRAGIEIPHLLVSLEWMAAKAAVPRPGGQRRRTDP